MPGPEPNVPPVPDRPGGRMALGLPAEDRQRSPWTGWTRRQWEATADHVLAAAVASTSSRGALVGPRHSTRMVRTEGFARAALLAAYRAVGASAGASGTWLLGWLERGLAAGTDPHGPEA